MTSQTVLFTIVAKNYLAFARCLMRSARRFHPEARRVVILADEPEGCFDPAGEEFDVILSQELGIPNAAWFHFKYSILELSTAVKPFAFELLFRRYGAVRVLYFDPDIRLYASLDPLLEQLNGQTAVLTPHLTEPVDDDLYPGELQILQAGVYNLGFCALSEGVESGRLLEWWQQKLYDQCVVDIPRGLFVDQGWMDLAPCLFSGVAVLRDPGYNVAYWNLKQRRIRLTADGYTAAGQPLRFFHFSGFDPLRPEFLSKHQNRLRLDDLGDASGLVLAYRDELFELGFDESRQWRYTWGFFRNGIPIADLGRAVLNAAPSMEQRIPDPFSDEGYRAFLAFWNAPHDPARSAGVTRLAYRIYTCRDDVKAAMPDIWGPDRNAFLDWMRQSAVREHGLHEDFLAPVETALREARSRRGNEGPVSPMVAEAIREASIELALEAQTVSPLEWLSQPEAQNGRVRLTRLARFVYDSRPDLQEAFPNVAGPDGVRFLEWLLSYGRYEVGIAGALLDPIRTEWKQAGGTLAARLRLLALQAGAAGRKRWGRLVRGLGSGEAPAAAPRRMEPACAPDAAEGTFGLNVIGHTRSALSVGESARNAVDAARAAGIDAAVRNLARQPATSKADLRAGRDSTTLPHRFNLFHVNADQIPWAASTAAPELFRGRYNIGYWHWELAEFPARWASSFTPLHEVWTPSQFCQEAFAQHAPVPVTLIPHAITIRRPDRIGRAHFGLPEGAFVFVLLFDLLSVFERKNPLGVIAAFAKAFGGSPECHLAIKVLNSRSRVFQMRRLREAAAGLPVTLLEEELSREEVAGLIASSDCLVSLHRSEGFGLTLAEAMALGKPVIATAYSGNMEFTREDTAFLVDYTMKRVGAGCHPYDADAEWADPSIEHAAAQMRAVAAPGGPRERIAIAGQEFIRRHYAPEMVGRQMRRRLEEILAGKRESAAVTAKSA
jgi:glycosyltransferase involved in cell wall biosynthesis